MSRSTRADLVDDVTRDAVVDGRATNPVRAMFPGIELRSARAAGDPPAADDAMPTLTGHFAVFNAWTEINSMWEGNFIERFAPGAFKKTFQEQGDKIRCLFQHGMDPQAGDKPLGPTETLKEDGIGGFYEVPMLDTSYCRDLVPGLEAGLYGASFRFRALREEWVEDPGASDHNPKGLPERTIKEAQVAEFGPVTFPAYDAATAGVRSMTDDFLIAHLGSREKFQELVEQRDARGDLPPGRAAAPADPPAAAAGTPEDEPARDAADPAPTVPADAAPDAPAGTDAPSETDAEADPHLGQERREPLSDPARGADTPTQKENSPMTIEQLKARLAEIRSRLATIDTEAGDAELSEALQTEHDALVTEERSVASKITSIEERRAAQRARVESAADAGRTEDGSEPGADEQRNQGDPAPAGGNGRRGRGTPPAEDLYDLAAVRRRALSSESEDRARGIFRDAALRAVDAEAEFFHPGADTDKAKSDIEALLRREARIGGGLRSEIAERIIATGSELYQRSFVKSLAGSPVTPEEQRALATFTGANGGFAVPYQLDPTLIHTSNMIVNPYRAISRVETIVTNEWRGVTSGAVDANYAAEGAEVADGTPTMTQPTANPERCHAFVPFSIEIDQDWPSALSEMAALIQDGKDLVEANKFTFGAGHGSNEPEGLVTALIAASKTVAAAGTAAYAVADLYKIEEAVPARYRPMAQWMANRFIFNKTRQFDTAGGANLWISLAEGIPNVRGGNTNATLIGYPANENGAMDAALTSASEIAVLGDFRHFLIVDRAGMDVEVVPHLFGANRRPTGQRGLYAIWRNTSKVLVPDAFRALVTG